MSRVLIAGDQRDVLEALRILLNAERRTEERNLAKAFGVNRESSELSVPTTGAAVYDRRINFARLAPKQSRHSDDAQTNWPRRDQSNHSGGREFHDIVADHFGPDKIAAQLVKTGQLRDWSASGDLCIRCRMIIVIGERKTGVLVLTDLRCWFHKTLNC